MSYIDARSRRPTSRATTLDLMRLRFSPDDEDAFNEARDALLDEFVRWLDRPEPECAELVGDAGLFLDWRHGYSTGVLDEFTEDDISEFLLEWCPRKLSAPPEGAAGTCRAVGAFIEFLFRTRRLVGGADRAARLMTLADDLAPAMRDAMADPANFGMAKSMFAGLGDVSGLSMDELKAVVQQQMDAHNALPIEQRRAATDRFFEPEPEPLELPFVYVPPPIAEVEEGATAAPLLVKVHALRGYLGPDGKPLTQKGNLKLADGRALIALLDTGDVMDPKIGAKTFKTKSTEELSRLTFILDVAKQAGAVRVHKRCLVSVKAWGTRSPLKGAAGLFDAIMELGPLKSRIYYRNSLLDLLDELLDDGIVHWLAPLLGYRTEMSFDDIVEWARSVVDQQLAPYRPDHWSPDLVDRLVQKKIARIMEKLELAGVLCWADRIETADSYGDIEYGGGRVVLTALGRHVLPDYLDEAGYALRRAEDLTDADGAALIDALIGADGVAHDSVLAGWQPGRSTVERVEMICSALVAAPDAKRRVMGFHALDLFDLDTAEPLVRQLLDSQVAGHAALWLMARDRADVATLGGFVDALVRVDILAGELDDPDELCEAFLADPDPLRLLDDMWRQATPETVLVLDMLGSHLKDPKLAKAARKAAMRHRSWMANRP